MDLVENDMDNLHEEIEYLVGHLVENDVNILYEEKIHLVEFSFIRVIDCKATPYTQVASNHKVHLLLRGSLSHGHFHLAHLLVVVATVDTHMFMTS